MLQHRGGGSFLGMIVVWLAGLAVLAVALGGQHGSQLGPIAGCTIPPTPRATNGNAPYSPQFQVFEDVGPAEAYVCHRAAYPRELLDWHLQGIDALRLNAVFRGQDVSFWHLNLRYTLGTYSTPSARYLTLMVSSATAFDTRPPTDKEVPGPGRIFFQSPIGTLRRITVGVHPANLIVNRGSVTVFWNQNGLNFESWFQAGDDFGLKDVLPILRSVR
jgi:hypothetical protein